MSNKKEEKKIPIFKIALFIFFLIFSIIKLVIVLGHMIIPIALIIMMTIFCMKIYRKGVYIGVKKEVYKDFIILNRDIGDTYSPAVLSYLYNQQIEVKKDLVASLLNLETKGYIKRNEKNQYYANNINHIKLGRDELYLYNVIKDNNLQNISYNEWFKYIIKEFEDKKFHEENKKNIDFWKTILKQLIINIIIFKIIAYICTYTSEITATAIMMYSMLFIPAANFLFFIIYFKARKTIYKNKIALSKLGKEEFKKWIKFENFIKQYTLIKEKTAEDMIIYGKFLPYAMVLNLNKDYINEAEKIFGLEKSKELEKTLEKEEILKEIFGKI